MKIGTTRGMCKDGQVWLGVSNDCGENGHLLGTSWENHYGIGIIEVKRTIRDGEFYVF